MNRYSIVNRNIQLANINLESKKIALDITKQQLKANIYNEVGEYNLLIVEYEANLKNVKAHKLNYEFIKKKSKGGVITYTDQMMGRKLYNQAIAEMLALKYKIIFKKMRLDYYLGKTNVGIE